ncbi:Phage tail sheath protein FI [hydrothermal vent metagenome]|uniref:Phage tail sheath protein FI n=1 Tax=hydrothermal vent metagenome TaxID=652676 RepID=A0A3B0QYN2_9ZZZZ
MTEYMTPGVFVGELSGASAQIKGVSTNTVAFLGQTERGIEGAQLITGFSEFLRVYGCCEEGSSYLSYAVRGFFENGGKRCYTGRIAAPGATHAYTVIDDKLVVSAAGRGAWGKRIEIKVEQFRTNLAVRLFNITISYTHDDDPNRKLVEKYDDLSCEDGASQNIITVINGASALVRLWWKGGKAAEAVSLSEGGLRLDKGGLDGGQVRAEDFQGGSGEISFKGPEELKPLVQPFGRGTGLAAFSVIGDISLLVLPEEVRPGFERLSEYAIEQCESLRDRFAIVSAPGSPGSLRGLQPPMDSAYAAYYFPWIKVKDSGGNATRFVPPGGHIAGIYGRVDEARGVHKAPANEEVRGALALQSSVTDRLQDALNRRGVNCIRDFQSSGRGLLLWGARTMSTDPEWRYVSVRRLFIFIEESIKRGTQWVVFESNNEQTWLKVKQVIEVFLINQWRSGALAGTKPEEAFFVKCGRDTMTEVDIEQGRIVILIGLAPIRAAEFTILNVSHNTGANI